MKYLIVASLLLSSLGFAEEIKVTNKGLSCVEGLHLVQEYSEMIGERNANETFADSDWYMLKVYREETNLYKKNVKVLINDISKKCLKQ